jgi:hypothetical protein
MQLGIRVSHLEGFMSAKVSGEASLDNFGRMIDDLSDESMRMNATRLLIDLRQVHERFKLAEHMTVSERAVSHLCHLEKVASVVPEGRRKGTSEQAARTRGVALRVFTSEDEAIAWLETH